MRNCSTSWRRGDNKLVAASSAKKDELDPLLKVCGADRVIEAATSSDDAEASKPAPDILHAALKEIGLPANYLPTALLTFNIGVEIGQLMTVGVAWLAWRALSRWPQTALGRVPVLYGIGAMAAFWSWTRVVAIFS